MEDGHKNTMLLNLASNEKHAMPENGFELTKRIDSCSKVAAIWVPSQACLVGTWEENKDASPMARYLLWKALALMYMVYNEFVGVGHDTAKFTYSRSADADPEMIFDVHVIYTLPPLLRANTRCGRYKTGDGVPYTDMLLDPELAAEVYKIHTGRLVVVSSNHKNISIAAGFTRMLEQAAQVVAHRGTTSMATKVYTTQFYHAIARGEYKRTDFEPEANPARDAQNIDDFNSGAQEKPKHKKKSLPEFDAARASHNGGKKSRPGSDTGGGVSKPIDNSFTRNLYKADSPYNTVSSFHAHVCGEDHKFGFTPDGVSEEACSSPAQYAAVMAAHAKARSRVVGCRFTLSAAMDRQTKRAISATTPEDAACESQCRHLGVSTLTRCFSIEHAMVAMRVYSKTPEADMTSAELEAMESMDDRNILERDDVYNPERAAFDQRVRGDCDGFTGEEGESYTIRIPCSSYTVLRPGFLLPSILEKFYLQHMRSNLSVQLDTILKACLSELSMVLYKTDGMLKPLPKKTRVLTPWETQVKEAAGRIFEAKLADESLQFTSTMTAMRAIVENYMIYEAAKGVGKDAETIACFSELCSGSAEGVKIYRAMSRMLARVQSKKTGEIVNPKCLDILSNTIKCEDILARATQESYVVASNYMNALREQKAIVYSPTDKIILEYANNRVDEDGAKYTDYTYVSNPSTIFGHQKPDFDAWAIKANYELQNTAHDRFFNFDIAQIMRTCSLSGPVAVVTRMPKNNVFCIGGFGSGKSDMLERIILEYLIGGTYKDVATSSVKGLGGVTTGGNDGYSVFYMNEASAALTQSGNGDEKALDPKAADMIHTIQNMMESQSSANNTQVQGPDGQWHSVTKVTRTDGTVWILLANQAPRPSAVNSRSKVIMVDSHRRADHRGATNKIEYNSTTGVSSSETRKQLVLNNAPASKYMHAGINVLCEYVRGGLVPVPKVSTCFLHMQGRLEKFTPLGCMTRSELEREIKRVRVYEITAQLMGKWHGEFGSLGSGRCKAVPNRSGADQGLLAVGSDEVLSDADILRVGNLQDSSSTSCRTFEANLGSVYGVDSLARLADAAMSMGVPLPLMAAWRDFFTLVRIYNRYVVGATGAEYVVTANISPDARENSLTARIRARHDEAKKRASTLAAEVAEHLASGGEENAEHAKMRVLAKEAAEAERQTDPNYKFCAHGDDGVKIAWNSNRPEEWMSLAVFHETIYKDALLQAGDDIEMIAEAKKIRAECAYKIPDISHLMCMELELVKRDIASAANLKEKNAQPITYMPAPASGQQLGAATKVDTRYVLVHRSSGLAAKDMTHTDQDMMNLVNPGNTRIFDDVSLVHSITTATDRATKIRASSPGQEAVAGSYVAFDSIGRFFKNDRTMYPSDNKMFMPDSDVNDVAYNKKFINYRVGHAVNTSSGVDVYVALAALLIGVADQAEYLRRALLDSGPSLGGYMHAMYKPDKFTSVASRSFHVPASRPYSIMLDTVGENSMNTTTINANMLSPSEYAQALKESANAANNVALVDFVAESKRITAENVKRMVQKSKERTSDDKETDDALDAACKLLQLDEYITKGTMPSNCAVLEELSLVNNQSYTPSAAWVPHVGTKSGHYDRLRVARAEAAKVPNWNDVYTESKDACVALIAECEARNVTPDDLPHTASGVAVVVEESLQNSRKARNDANGDDNAVSMETSLQYVRENVRKFKNGAGDELAGSHKPKSRIVSTSRKRKRVAEVAGDHIPLQDNPFLAFHLATLNAVERVTGVRSAAAAAAARNVVPPNMTAAAAAAAAAAADGPSEPVAKRVPAFQQSRFK